MALPNVPQEREHGAVKEQEQLEAAAPPPIEATPAQMDETSLDAAMAVVEQTPVAQPAQQPAPEQQPQQPNMWRIPQNYAGVLGQEHKPVMQRQEDVGYLWSALAVDPNVNPMVRMIAEKLTGGRR